MVTQPEFSEVQALVNRLSGPAASEMTDLIARAALHRPVMVDAAAASAAIRPYSWLLGRIGVSGIQLTKAGYLPPAVVTEAFAALGWNPQWIGAGGREHLSPPMLRLRQSARRMALVRTHRGVLFRTALGERLHRDPGRLWWHIAGRLPDARQAAERDAGLLLLLAVASATPLDAEVAHDRLRRGMAALGWKDTRTGQPLDAWQVLEAACNTWSCLHWLGAIPEPRRGRSPAPPRSAAVSLARAALRGPVG